MTKTRTPRYRTKPATPPKPLAAPGFTIKAMPAGVSLISYNRQTTDSAGGVITNTPCGLFNRKTMTDLPDDGVDGLRPLVLVELPRGAPSDFVDFNELMATYQRRLPKRQRRILLQWTIYATDPALTLWDEILRARAFTALIAAELGVASLLVQHVPANAGLAQTAHIHILILPRVLTRHGFGAIAEQLITDKAGEILAGMWTRFTATWS